MSNLHNALNRGPLGDAVKRAIGQHKQGEGGLERYSETLQSTIDPWSLPEWAVLRGERLGALSMPATATPAELGIVGLALPPTANAIAVVEACTLSATATAMICSLGVDTFANLSGTTVGAAPGTFRDKRFSGATTPRSLQIFTGSDPAGLAALIILEVQNAPVLAATTPTGVFSVGLPVILRPGDAIAVVAQTVNVAFRVNWRWRERTPFPGELA